MADEAMLSREGNDKLAKELEMLKMVERPRIADNIREAKSHGDLRENAMYHEAKLNQQRLEGRIADLEKTLQFAKVIDPSQMSGAHLGSRVKLADLEWGGELTIDLVGAFEADPLEDRISITSPMGAALLEKNVGDEIEVEAPAGTQRYRILAID